MIFYELIKFGGKSPTIWGSMDRKETFVEWLKYLLASAEEGSLKDFVVLAVEKDRVRAWDLYSFCGEEGIK